MDRVETKICGLSTPETIDAVINGGASYLGFIFFEKSPRHVTIEQAKALADHVAGRIAIVAVSVNADNPYLDEIVDAVKPKMLQLHGNETPERLKFVKDRYNRPVMKAFSIQERADLDAVQPYVGIADRFLFDAKAPKGSLLPGGNGVAFDWEIMDHVPDSVPYMLSGGLNAENIREAVQESGASSVDVSSGVETKPGVKDVVLIEEFLNISQAK
ncbi:MAG: phosphoribosylanthranilate isomerase [Pseudomonadota bacterium]